MRNDILEGSVESTLAMEGTFELQVMAVSLMNKLLG
jgi:hypothetical protein